MFVGGCYEPNKHHCWKVVSDCKTIKVKFDKFIVEEYLSTENTCPYDKGQGSTHHSRSVLEPHSAAQNKFWNLRTRTRKFCTKKSRTNLGRAVLGPSSLWIPYKVILTHGTTSNEFCDHSAASKDQQVKRFTPKRDPSAKGMFRWQTMASNTFQVKTADFRIKIPMILV